MAKSKKSFSARIDEDIYDSIAAYCKENETSQAQLLERWAREFFDMSAPATDLESRMNELEKKLQGLSLT